MSGYLFLALEVGGDAIYNFSGRVHQKPLQVLNAEFS